MATPHPPLWPLGHRRHIDVLRIAHRGGSTGAAPYRPDNLERLAHWGMHLLEFDVRATRDDKLVVAHDPVVVDRSCSEVRIDESSLGELQAALGGASEEFDFGVVVGRARTAGLGLYIDVKTLTPGSAKLLVQVIDREGMGGHTILASADPAVVALCAEALPDLPRSILFVSAHLNALDLARSVDAHFVHPCWEHLVHPHHRLANAEWFTALRRDGLGIVCWHVEDRDVANGLYALGVDGICTDDPELLASIAAASTDS